ncbi:hypothetical protein GMMP15_2030001 [Candidatus Magnetomoraceae bacterium gMMP-15]
MGLLFTEELQQWKQAEEYLLKALRIFNEYKDQHYIDITLGNLFNLCEESNDNEVLTAIAEVLGMEREDVEKMFEE